MQSTQWSSTVSELNKEKSHMETKEKQCGQNVTRYNKAKKKKGMKVLDCDCSQKKQGWN